MEVATKRALIRQKAIDLLKENPNGLRWSDLLKRLRTEFPQVSPNTIQGNIWNLDVTHPNEVYKPARGEWRHISFRSSQTTIGPSSTVSGTQKIQEDDFYQHVADYLQNDLNECSKAIKLGGNRFQDRWGTPDAIGIFEAPRSAMFHRDPEIISAEVKINTSELITAFGQACSYRSFSHKSYLVIPKQSHDEDIDRLDALCNIFGIGLILFDNTNPSSPGFQLRVRASKHEPNLFFVNKYMPLVEKELFS